MTPNTTPHPNPDTPTEPVERLAEDVRARVEAAAARVRDLAVEVAGSFERIGRLWASHGLDLGRAALERTSTVLRNTAAELRKLSDAIDPEADEAEAERA
jgi:hypothetical protein